MSEFGFPYGSLIGEPGLLISIAHTNHKRAWEFYNAGLNRNIEQMTPTSRNGWKSTAT